MDPFIIARDDDPLSIAEKQYEIFRVAKDRHNAFITLREKDKILEEVEKSQGPLKGLLIPVKDNIVTKGILTTCGSRILSNYIPPYDAYVVEVLKRHGAVVVGKTNMDEFAMGNTNETSYFGPVTNPWNVEHVPGGSSGGSAVATALGGYVSLGSDTGGSVRQPASYCYVLGYKPTYGLLSRYGLISYADSLEQIGIFSKFTSDLALILYYVSSYDPRDSTMPSNGYRDDLRKRVYNMLSGDIDLDPEDVSIAYSDEIVDLSEEDVKKRFYEVVDRLEREGFRLYHVNMDFMKAGLPTYYIIAMVEASSNLYRYDGVQYGLMEKVGDYWRSAYITRSRGFGEEVKRRIIMGTLLSSKGYEGKYYIRALKLRRWIRDSMQRILKRYDLVLIPTTPAPPPRFGEAVGPKGYVYDLYTVIPNLTGHPALSIPTGFIDGLPIGIQVITNWFNDDILLRFSKYLENRIYEPGKVPET